MNCVFCNVAAGAEPFEVEAPGIISFPDRYPSVSGHMLVIPCQTCYLIQARANERMGLGHE